MNKVVTRFAPSPTGFMHIGGVRTALFAYLWARKNNGTFILRIEDTDKDREVAGSIEHIQDSLRWLGIDWDYGPDTENPFGSAIQSQRLSTYRDAAEDLLRKGLAYPDPYTPAELAAFRDQANADKRPFLYRNHRPETFNAWDGVKPLRFKVPEIKRYVWTDAVRGTLEAGEEMLDDFILIKSDGYPTYNFAHIIDDRAMGVTHIMRADEFIASTPKFLSLYDALEIPYPVFVTLPPILRDDKTKKMGKRDGAKDMLEYRTEGYLPEAMVNFLALIGWNPGTEQEIFTKEQLIAAFQIDQIQKHGGVANEEKLVWFNRQHLLAMPKEEFDIQATEILHVAVDRRGVAWDEAIASKLLPILRERISIWSDIDTQVATGEFDFFFVDPQLDAAAIPQKGTSSADTITHLGFIHETLTSLPESEYSDPMHIKDALWSYASEHGRGAVLWPLRYALSGRERSPDPFVIASIIGKERACSRVQTAMAALSV